MSRCIEHQENWYKHTYAKYEVYLAYEFLFLSAMSCYIPCIQQVHVSDLTQPLSFESTLTLEKSIKKQLSMSSCLFLATIKSKGNLFLPLYAVHSLNEVFRSVSNPYQMTFIAILILIIYSIKVEFILEDTLNIIHYMNIL